MVATGLAGIVGRMMAVASPREHRVWVAARGRRDLHRAVIIVTGADAVRDVLLAEAARQGVARVAVVDPAGTNPVEQAVAQSAITLDADGTGAAEAGGRGARRLAGARRGHGHGRGPVADGAPAPPRGDGIRATGRARARVAIPA